jgi:hypothetical protein
MFAAAILVAAMLVAEKPAFTAPPGGGLVIAHSTLAYTDIADKVCVKIENGAALADWRAAAVKEGFGSFVDPVSGQPMPDGTDVRLHYRSIALAVTEDATGYRCMLTGYLTGARDAKEIADDMSSYFKPANITYGTMQIERSGVTEPTMPTARLKLTSGQDIYIVSDRQTVHSDDPSVNRPPVYRVTITVSIPKENRQ